MDANAKRSRRLKPVAIAALWICIAGLALALPIVRKTMFGSPQPSGAAAQASRSTAGSSMRPSASASTAAGRTAADRVAALRRSLVRDTMTTRDDSGWLRTVSRDGRIDTGNAFFQVLGSNGRSCDTCHRMEAGWSLTPAEVRARFAATGGTDPLFSRNDGTNSPVADVSTVAARRRASSMLLHKAVIRIGIGIPANAEFSLVAVDDPYHFASARELSLFRRPLPATNLGFLTGIMWDGRETTAPFLPPMHAGQDATILTSSLIRQATDATIGHAQGLDPTPDQLAQIVSFESGLSTAQIRDDAAGFLNVGDAIGGPRILANQRFYVGINDTLGADPTGAIFDPGSMNLFGAWSAPGDASRRSRARAAIARGEQLFNHRSFRITGVKGLNDRLGLAAIDGTCTTCHNAPNVGSHTVTLPLDIGIADASRRTPDMPLYTLRNTTTGEVIRTTDPGLALVTGKWKDIGLFKGPVLRGLAARPPYFHDGSAATVEDVLDFYDARFDIGLSAREKRDMAAFLRSL